MERELDILRKELQQNTSIILACSGGPDSMCLLSLLLSLKKEFNLKIICAHVNHKKRIESEEEEEFLRKYCEENQLTFELFVLKEYKDNFQENARDQRYEFLNKLQQKYNASAILTAHHGDDLIETVLMRITRGSNLSGYAGLKMVYVNETHKILKPLLLVDKNEVIKYNQEKNVPYRLDKSNESDDYTRNRYRKHMLPFLKKESNKIHLKYYSFSEKLNEYDQFVKNYVEKSSIILDDKIDLIKYNLESEFIKNRVLETYISNIQKTEKFNVSDQTLIEINKLINSQSGKGTIDLSNGFKGIKEKKEFFIQK